MPSNNISEKEYIAEEEINLLDYLAVIVKYRRMIFRMCTVVVIISVIISLVSPKIYSSTTVIMPPKKEQSAFSSLAARMGGLAFLAQGAMGGSNPVDIYVEMLKSRTLVDTMIERFQLMEVYGAKRRAEAQGALKSFTEI